MLLPTPALAQAAASAAGLTSAHRAADPRGHRTVIASLLAIYIPRAIAVLQGAPKSN